MKLRYSYFIAKANNKGDPKSSILSILMLVLTVAFSLVSVFSAALTRGVGIYKNEVRARTLMIYPFHQLLYEDVLEQVKEVDHVEWIDMHDEMRNNWFDIVGVRGKDGSGDELQKFTEEKKAIIDIWSLIGGEHVDVIYGKTLDESPLYSCIIPNLFYPDMDADVYDDKVGFLDARRLIGTTLILRSSGDTYFFDYNVENGEGTGDADMTTLPGIEIRLKIVGVYYDTPTSFGNPHTVYISEETGRQVQQKAIAGSGGGRFIQEYNERPEFHSYYVVFDDQDHMDSVYNDLIDRNVTCFPDTEMWIDGGAVSLDVMFRIVSRLLVAGTLILCLMNVIRSATDMLVSRRSEIGLLKAVGYKNNAVFRCIALEQLLLTMRGFFAGAGISAFVIAIANQINRHSTFSNMLYIMDWGDYARYLGIALAIAVLVPLLCEGIVLHKLAGIQPGDAMG